MEPTMAGPLPLKPASELAGFSGSRRLFQPRLPSPDLNDGCHAAHISEHPSLLYVLTAEVSLNGLMLHRRARIHRVLGNCPLRL